MQRIIELNISQIRQSRHQRRKKFDETKLQELADSILESGLINPPTVCKTDTPDVYELIAGERRWRASGMAGLHSIPVVLFEGLRDKESAVMSVIENIQRVNLCPIEEAEDFRKLQEIYGMTQEEISRKVGQSRAAVANALRLLNLPPECRQWISDGQLTVGHGKVLAGINNIERVRELAAKVISKKWTVRKLEREAQVLNAEAEAEDDGSADLERLSRLLSDHLGASVGLDFDTNKKAGELKIRYADLDVLQGILEKMSFDIKQL